MNKCLKITFVVPEIPEGFLSSFIQKHARKLEIEGTAQIIEGNIITIIACGMGENLDALLDVIHKGVKGVIAEDIEIEPFLNKKDYREVFRVIE